MRSSKTSSCPDKVWLSLESLSPPQLTAKVRLSCSAARDGSVHTGNPGWGTRLFTQNPPNNSPSHSSLWEGRWLTQASEASGSAAPHGLTHMSSLTQVSTALDSPLSMSAGCKEEREIPCHPGGLKAGA